MWKCFISASLISPVQKSIKQDFTVLCHFKFLALEIEILHRIQALKYRHFHCETRVNVEERGDKIGVHIFLTVNERHTPKSVECLPPLLQPSHLLNQYFKRHYDICKGFASWAYCLFLKPPNFQKLIPLEQLFSG